MAVRDPSYAIQLAVVAALQASPDMAAAFGGTPAVYDSVPLDTSGSIDTAKFPYVTIGEDQLVGMTTQGADATEIYVKVDTWSRPQGNVDNSEVKLIAGAVRAALDAPIAVPGHDVVTHELRGHIFKREPDGLTRHAITTIRYRTTPIGVSPSNV